MYLRSRGFHLISSADYRMIHVRLNTIECGMTLHYGKGTRTDTCILFIQSMQYVEGTEARQPISGAFLERWLLY